MEFSFLWILIFCVFIKVGNLFKSQHNPSVNLVDPSQNVNLNLNLIPVTSFRKYTIKHRIQTKKLIPQVTEKSIKSRNSRRYVWNDFGKFWTYRRRDYVDYRDDFDNVPNEPCQPPFCVTRNCNKYKCGPRRCQQSSRDCGTSSVQDCGFGQKSVKFGNKVVCMNDEPENGCVPKCGTNGICIKNKCYCQSGYHGVSCLIMDLELCKAKKGLVCAEGCSVDYRDNQYKCVCADNEFRSDCLELRICVPPCQNGGVCMSGKCQCQEGFHGTSCEIDVDACSPGQMGNRTCDQLCVSEGKERFMCKCREGYNLNINGRTCDKKRCSENGTSKIINGNCQCKRGWKGVLCNEDFNECEAMNVCAQICHNTIGSFECRCRPGYVLVNNDYCERICPRNCSSRGDCLSGKCHCFPGWYGDDCSLDVDECKYSHGCEFRCTNLPGSYVCHCPQGRTLAPDKRTCLSVPCGGQCLNGGTCTDNKCSCQRGFVGPQCETVDFCSVFSPCDQICRVVNDSISCSCNESYTLMSDGRSCARQCHCVHGQCLNEVCICDEGFRGSKCDEDIDECLLKVHECQHLCQNSIGSYNCSCFDGFEIMLDGRSCGQRQCPVCVRGKCVNNKCVCPSGFYGEKCEHDRDECRNGTLCDHFCSNTVGSYQCSCRTGYRLGSNGRTCDRLDRDPCSKVICVRGICANGSCICDDGFTGTRCELDINECNFGSLCSQICTNEIGTYRCSCYPGYVLASDQKHCVENCPNCGKGFCRDGVCVCPTGLYGNKCQFDIDECDKKSHGCEQVCTNVIGSYNCSCYDDFVLNSDGKTCSKVSCSDGCKNGVCLNGICLCSSGFKGPTCEVDVDECSTGEHNCAHICQNSFGSFSCSCFYNYTLATDGRSCIDTKCGSCVHGNCKNDGKCSCLRGYTGTSCDQDIDECKMWGNVCQHGCINTVGSYKCTCRPGYRLTADRHSCQSICSQCKNGQCDPVSGRCRCHGGWDGEICDKDIDECQLRKHKCDHNCINTIGSYECSCMPLYYLSNFDGRSCVKEDNNCPVPCKNDGKCIDKKCECRPGFAGPSCEEDVNECLLPKKTHRCIGECRNTFGNYECICPPGYIQLEDQKTCKIASKDTMCSPPCQNGGVCRDMSRCYCPLGFQGVDCSVDIDECVRYSPCDARHGKCTNTYGTYYCQCKRDYVLMYDGTSCMQLVEAVLRPHLRYRGRGTKGFIPPLVK